MTFKKHHLCLLILLIFSVCPSWAQLKYERGGSTYELSNNKSSYVVTCKVPAQTSNSRVYTLAVSRTRLTAKNLIGASILFHEFASCNKLDDSYFQMFVDCVSVNYKAEISDFVQKGSARSDGEIIYECPKDKYRIHEASYRKITDLEDLLQTYYNTRKDSYSAGILYSHGNLSLKNSVSFFYEYLSGKARISETYSRLQSYHDRFDESVYSDNNQVLFALVNNAAECVDKHMPFKSCCEIEMVTAARLKEKKTWYARWTNSLSRDVLAEQILLFCSQKCTSVIPKENVLTTDLILAYPGAISPFALRKGLDSDYSRAANLYSQSKFEEAAIFLEDAINLNGITDRTLCLLGASLRLSDKPEMALPYLILCTYLNPKTEYLAGNIALCLASLNFKNLENVLQELNELNIDSWSRKQIELLKHQTP